MRRRGRVIGAGLSGVIAGVLGLAVSELVALLVAPSASPISAIASLMIDLAPPGAKNAMIAAFGTGDKTALITGLLIFGLVLSALTGWIEWRRPVAGSALVVAAALLGAVAIGTRQGSSAIWFLPLIAGAVLAIVVLRALVRRLPHPHPSEPEPDAAAAASDRRAFLRAAGIAGAVTAIAGISALVGRSVSGAAQAVVDRIRLPRPASPAAAVPAGAELDIRGLTPYVTSRADFYRIDTAIVVPRVDPSTWRLRIHGMVDHEVTIDLDELLRLPLVERYVTLTCVSNDVGGDLIGNARWLGYPVRKLLARAAPSASADMVLSRSTDGFTAGTPLTAMQDPGRDAIVAVGMNGETLPLEHGFPARLVVPGLYGYVSATKWVTDLEVTRFDRATAYWTDRGWSARGPIKTESRIDVPRDGTQVPAGTTVIAGVAWAQHTGIARVEVRIDGDAWQEADLASAVSDDTWVQWSTRQALPSGQHRVEVRATDRSGYTQTGQEQGTVPNGATGWHTIRVTVG